MRQRAVGHTIRGRRLGVLLCAALTVVLVPLYANAQNGKFNVPAYLFPVTGNEGQTTTLPITLTQPTAIRSIIMPQALHGVSDFALIGQTGCVIDGVTVNPAGAVCQLSIFFLPQGPSFRFGSFLITDGDGNSFAFGISGVGYYPRVAISPSASTIVAGFGPNSPAYAGDGIASVLNGISGPMGMAADRFGNIYIADTGNNAVRMIDVFGNMTIVAGGGSAVGAAADGGAARDAKLVQPTYVAVDPAGNLFISETGSNVVRRVDMATSRKIYTVAGNYTAGFTDNVVATSAQLNAPTGIAADPGGNLFIADNGNHRLRKVDPSGIISTIAGNGEIGISPFSGSAADIRFSAEMGGLASVDTGGPFVADTGNHVVLACFTSGGCRQQGGSGTSGNSGDGGNIFSAQFMAPAAIAADASGGLYILDRDAGVIRKEKYDGTMETVAGDAANAGGYSTGVTPSNALRMNRPSGMVFDTQGNLYVADTGNNVIRKIPRVPGELVFGTQDVGTSSAPQTVQIHNVGNDDVSVATYTGMTPPLSNFSVSDAPGGTSCADALKPGRECSFAVTFAPKQTGSVTEEIDFLHTLRSDQELLDRLYLLGGPNAALALGPETLPYADSGKPYAATIATTGGVGKVIVDYYGSLPEGITAVVGDTGVTFSGSSTAIGAYFLTVYASDTLGATVARNYYLTVVPPPIPLEVTDVITVHDAITSVPGLTLTDDESVLVHDMVTNVPGLTLADDESIAVHDAVTPVPGLTLSDEEAIAVHDSVSSQVPKLDQTITLPAIGAHTYGDAAFDVSATSSSHLPVTVLLVSGPAKLNGTTLDITGAGTIKLLYQQDGNDSYYAATGVFLTINVSRATASVTAQDATRVFGAPDRPFAYTITNLVHGDTAASLGGVPLLSTTAKTNSNAGAYPILVSQGSLPSANYVYQFQGAMLTITGGVSQTITFLRLPNIPVRFSSLTLTAYSTSGLSITYVVSGPASISGNKLTLTGTGNVTVTATQTGNATFKAATSVSHTFTVTP